MFASKSNQTIKKTTIFAGYIGSQQPPFFSDVYYQQKPPTKTPDAHWKGLSTSQKYWPVNKKHIPFRELTYPPPKVYLKMIFLFPRWDMLVPWRESHNIMYGLPNTYNEITGWTNKWNTTNQVPSQEDTNRISFVWIMIIYRVVRNRTL